MKRKRENQKVEEKKNECIDSSLPEEAIENVPYQSIVTTKIDIQATTPEDNVMCLFSELEKFGTKEQLWERSQIQRRVIISAKFVLINEDLLLQET